MSRSYRRPFAAVTGTASAKQDKRMAHRGVRQKQKLALKTCGHYEDLLLPHHLECSWNNIYCWGRDGGQCYLGWMCNSDEDDFREWYQKVLRK